MQKSLRYDGSEPTRQLCIRVRILNRIHSWMGSQCKVFCMKEAIWPNLGISVIRQAAALRRD